MPAKVRKFNETDGYGRTLRSCLIVDANSLPKLEADLRWIEDERFSEESFVAKGGKEPAAAARKGVIVWL